MSLLGKRVRLKDKPGQRNMPSILVGRTGRVAERNHRRGVEYDWRVTLDEIEPRWASNVIYVDTEEMEVIE